MNRLGRRTLVLIAGGAVAVAAVLLLVSVTLQVME
jgi:hypothetical protein